MILQFFSDFLQPFIFVWFSLFLYIKIYLQIKTKEKFQDAKRMVPLVERSDAEIRVLASPRKKEPECVSGHLRGPPLVSLRTPTRAQLITSTIGSFISFPGFFFVELVFLFDS